MSKFKTTKEIAEQHFTIALITVSVILTLFLTIMVKILEQHHEMERAINKKYLNK